MGCEYQQNSRCPRLNTEVVSYNDTHIGLVQMALGLQVRTSTTTECG